MIVLLGMVLLAGLIVYVVNVGTQVNNRLGMQNAADSAAISGATWMARSMNLIAMNNVAQTRMLALVPILDAFPLATAMALDDAAPWYQALDTQVNKGLQSPYALEQKVVITDPLTGLTGLRTDLASQNLILQSMNTFFNDSANDVSKLTFWQIDGQPGPPPHGQLWQAARALADMSAAVNDASGVLSQSNAVRYGKDNGAQTSFVVPILPDKPGRQGAYSDFWLPLRGHLGVGNLPCNIPEGTIPDRYPPYDFTEASIPPPSRDDRYRLGPFDRLFQWRSYQYDYMAAPGGGAAGAPAPSQPLYGSDSLSGGGVMGSTAQIPGSVNPGPGLVPFQTKGYTTYGPYTWMLRQVYNYVSGSIDPATGKVGGLWSTSFYRDMATISRYKLGYLCPWNITDRDPKSIHYPQWVTKYPEAIALAATQAQTINRTAFFVVSISSRIPRGDPLYLSPGTYVANYIGGRKSPVVYVRRGWFDPNVQNGWQRLCDYIWHDEATKMTTTPWDAIGLTIPVDSTGNPVAQNVYVVRYFVFVGIDIGQTMDVRNPANWTDENDPALPAPLLLSDTIKQSYDQFYVKFQRPPNHDEDVRRDVFTYLGVCQADNAAAVWSQKFGRPGPYDGVVGVSQAEIFNTTSWDLWTQDWKVKLTPVSNMADWAGKMAADSQQAGNTQGQVRGEDVDRVREYMEKFDPTMIDDMMQH